MKYAAWFLVLGGCSISFDEVGQKVADPAPTLTITSARFHSAVGGSMVEYCSADTTACTTAPPTQVRWGQPVDGISKSGLGWGFAAPHVVTYNAAFDIGALTHF